jgi:hypothetical protein
MIVFSLDHLVAVAASRLQATASLSRTAALGQPSFAPGYSHASHCPLPHGLAHAAEQCARFESIPRRRLPPQNSGLTDQELPIHVTAAIHTLDPEGTFVTLSF